MAKAEKKDTKELKDLLLRIRDRFKVMVEADEPNRRKAMEDLKFAFEPGCQWDETLKKERGDRPCYEFNKLRITIKRVINHIRANRPQGKVRAVEDSDKDTADIYEGLIRNIWNVSDGDTVVDYAAEYVIAGGMGAWRVTTEYSDDTVFDQDIFIRPIKNPFCLYADPSAADPFKRDAEDWILTEKISNKSYEARWPKAKRVSFEDESFDDDDAWEEEEQTRICEYWYKKPVTKTLYLLEGGQTVDTLPEGVTPLKTREVKTYKICMVIASGDAILEGPKEWAGSKFPFVMVPGEWRVIDGKVQWHGLTRFSKDAQRNYNVSRTAIAETIALTPQAKWLMSMKQFEGMGDHIAEAHRKNIPVMLYNSTPNEAPPQWMGGAQVPVGLVQQSAMDSDDIKATSGIFDSSLGNQSNETSGRAIRARQEQGEIATYNYPDNIAKGIRVTNEIIVDLIPKIIDSTRAIRILGADGAEKYMKVNEVVPDPNDPTGLKTIVVNDLSRGKYDVTVTTGPSYSTQRQEAAEVYTQLGQAVPQVWGVAGDYIMKAMDLPYSEQIAERLRYLLPPQIQQSMADGKPVPPEVQAVMAKAEQAMQVVQMQTQLIQQAAQEVEQSKAESEKAKSDVEQTIAKLNVAKAQFEADVAKELAKLTQQKAALQVQEANLNAHEAQINAAGEVVNEKAQGVGAIEQQSALSLAAIEALLQQFTQAAAGIMQRLEQKPTRKVGRSRRLPTGEVEYEILDAPNVQ